MIVESGNPAHSLADGPRMREALEALDFVVVIDVALTETGRLADYVLPVASQFEKAEATFFNFEFPENYFHLRRALLAPLPGLFSEAELHARIIEALAAMPSEAVATLRTAWRDGDRAEFRAKFLELAARDARLLSLAPVVLYRAIGDLLPEGLAEGATLWAICQIAAPRIAKSLARAGFEGPPAEAADALFDAILAAPSAVVFAIDEWDETFERVRTPSGRIELAVPELFPELDALASESLAVDPAFPLVLSAGERRAFTANTIIRNPDWRKRDRSGALRIHPDDAKRAGVGDGDRARLTTRRGSAEVAIEVSDRMQPGHVSLPNGLGLEFPVEGGARSIVGTAPNELTRGEDRDWLAGTPWHKHTPARVEPLGT